MTQASPEPVRIPLVNPNETEARIASLNVSEGQLVEEGEVLCTLETTKATTEIVAARPGYVIQLRHKAGQTVRAGELLCYLAGSPDWSPLERESDSTMSQPGDQPGIPGGLRITKPALAFARKENLNLEELPAGPLITESMLRDLVRGRKASVLTEEVPAEFGERALVIYGGGGHGKKLIDLIRVLGSYQIAGIVDDGILQINEDGSQNRVMDVPVLGGGGILRELAGRGLRLAANGIGGIANPELRVQIYQQVQELGFVFPSLIHPTAVVEPSSEISPGGQIFPLAYVGSEARLGFGVILNNSVVISHDCNIGDYANISPGALIAGNVEVGERALVGMGVTINLGVKIGSNARIGNGATVKADVPENGVVRAGSVWPR